MPEPGSINISSTSSGNSPATDILTRLLQCWPRRTINQVLFSETDAKARLLGGEVESRLSLDAAGKRRKRPLKFSHSPAISAFDRQFPRVLEHIPDPPIVLFYSGLLASLNQPSIAIVGARRATQVGRQRAEEIAAELASLGLVIVSGLAYGIDRAAHVGALAVGGTTIAVLGSGLNRVYPSSHQRLARELIDKNGLMLSEYPSDWPPRPYQFPERNRLISGLTNAVVVVEAGLHSGSLITARLALEQGREVFAVPGSVSSLVSAGSHRLIREGAELVTCASEIAQSLGIEPIIKPSPSPAMTLGPELTPDQHYILQFLRGYRASADELCVLSDWPVSKLLQVLGHLEVLGIVHADADGYIAAF
ncbi:MAG: DNA processing protein [Limisphaerales bacterium]|jgi:DNA processing protein